MMRKKQDRQITDYPVNYSFFKRSKATTFVNLSTSHYKFKLLGIARSKVSGIEIYLTYFWSPYASAFKELNDQQHLERSHISQFFLFYVQIFTLKCLLNHEATSKPPKSFISMVICDLVGDRTKESIDVRLKRFIESYVNYLCDRMHPLLKAHQNQTPYQRFLIIQSKILQIFTNICSLVDQQQQFQKLKKDEILPKYYEDRLIKKIIKQNMKAICDIKTLSKRLMKRLFSQFYEINKHHFFMKIPKAFENKRSINQDHIYMPAYTQEEYPVITEMHNIIDKLHEQDHQSHILNELSIQLLHFCLNYTKNTSNFYPNISFTHLYLDQKSLKLIISYSPLLLDVLGLQEDVRSFQLRLATDPTPRGIDYEQCYLQQLEEHKCLLKYNFYCNQIISRGKQYCPKDQNNHSPHKVHDLQEKIHVWRLLQIIYYIHHQRNFINDYYNGKFTHSREEILCKPRKFYYNVYKERLKEAYIKIEQGQILISMLFPSMSQQDIIGTSITPFNFTLQSLARSFQVETDDSDSLIEYLRFQKFRQAVYEKCMLCKEIINSLIHPSFFKKMLNAKKYFLFYFVGVLEWTGFQSAIRQKSKFFLSQNSMPRQVKSIGKTKRNMNKIGTQQRIRSLFQQEINNLNVSCQIEFRKGSNREVYGKLREYTSREDANKFFLQNNQSVMRSVEDIERQLAQISVYMQIEKLVQASDETNIRQLSQQLRCIQIKNQYQERQLQEHIHCIFQLQKIVQTQKRKLKTNQDTIIKTLQEFQSFLSKNIQQKLANVLQKANNLLVDFLSIHVNNDFIRPESIHRVVDLMNENEKRAFQSKKQVSLRLEQACRWYHLRLTALVEALCCCDNKQACTYQYKLINLFLIHQLKLPISRISLEQFATQRLKIQTLMLLKVQAKYQQSLHCDYSSRLCSSQLLTYISSKQVENI